MKSTIFAINTLEKNGRTLLGSVKNTASKAQIGANKITENPLYATNINNPKDKRIIIKSIEAPPILFKFS